MPEFRIKSKGWNITIETDSLKYGTLERLLLIVGIHMIEKRKTEELKSVLAILSDRLQEFERSPPKRKRKSKTNKNT
jgi:hypothetical protein